MRHDGRHERMRPGRPWPLLALATLFVAGCGAGSVEAAQTPWPPPLTIDNIVAHQDRWDFDCGPEQVTATRAWAERETAVGRTVEAAARVARLAADCAVYPDAPDGGRPGHFPALAVIAFDAGVRLEALGALASCRAAFTLHPSVMALAEGRPLPPEPAKGGPLLPPGAMEPELLLAGQAAFDRCRNETTPAILRTACTARTAEMLAEIPAFIGFFRAPTVVRLSATASVELCGTSKEVPADVRAATAGLGAVAAYMEGDAAGCAALLARVPDGVTRPTTSHESWMTSFAFAVVTARAYCGPPDPACTPEIWEIETATLDADPPSRPALERAMERLKACAPARRDTERRIAEARFTLAAARMARALGLPQTCRSLLHREPGLGASEPDPDELAWPLHWVDTLTPDPAVIQALKPEARETRRLLADCARLPAADESGRRICSPVEADAWDNHGRWLRRVGDPRGTFASMTLPLETCVPGDPPPGSLFPPERAFKFAYGVAGGAAYDIGDVKSCRYFARRGGVFSRQGPPC